MPVVTITGQVGSPLRTIGLEVARFLGSEYLDYQILSEAARRVGAPVEALVQKDERAVLGRERLARFFHNFLEKSAAAGSAGDPFLGPSGIEILMSRSVAEAAQPATTSAQEVGDHQYIDVLTSVIQETSETGNVVLIGRGGFVILQNQHQSLPHPMVSH